MPRKLSSKRSRVNSNADADDLKRELVRFGQKFMTVLYSADAIAVRRLAIAESRHSDIGKLSFEQATVPIEKQVAEFLRKVMKRGALRTADPKIAAMHLLSLLESELLQRVLLGVIDSCEAREPSVAPYGARWMYSSLGTSDARSSLRQCQSKPRRRFASWGHAKLTH